MFVKFCGNESRKLDIKNHIEGVHLEGISIPCNLCEKNFNSRYGLRKHNKRLHGDDKNH